VENAFYADEGEWIESVSVAAGAAFDPDERLAELANVELFHHRTVPTDDAELSVYRLTMVANEPYPFLLGVILREHALPNRLVLRQGRLQAVVTVAEWEGFRTLADRVEERFEQFTLRSVDEVDSIGEPMGSGQLVRVVTDRLSAEQLTVLKTAYGMGYFDVPRGTSADDVATDLGIAQSTLSERLRAAQKQLLDLMFASETRSNDATDGR